MRGQSRDGMDFDRRTAGLPRWWASGIHDIESDLSNPGNGSACPLHRGDRSRGCHGEPGYPLGQFDIKLLEGGPGW